MAAWGGYLLPREEEQRLVDVGGDDVSGAADVHDVDVFGRVLPGHPLERLVGGAHGILVAQEADEVPARAAQSSVSGDVSASEEVRRVPAPCQR